MKVLISAALLLLCVLGYSESVRAQEEVRVRSVDYYISGFGGYSFPFSTDLVFGGLTAPNVKLKDSLSVGGKIGMWLTAPRKRWGIDVGVELDVTHFNPDIRNSTLELDATYFGLNVLARLPMGVMPDLPNGRWFPYVGIGGGGQRLAMEAPGTNEGRNTAPAFQGLGGIKVFLNKHFAVFAEGKFIYASHNQELEGTSIPLELDLTSVHGVGGLSFHF